MALTQVPIELSSTPGIVDNSNATAITIDSSENVLVGKTASSAATAGHEFKADGAAWHTADSTFPLFLNRETNDGELIRFRKDNGDVGSISSKDSNIFIGTGDTGVRFSSGTDSVFPIDTSTGNGRDAAIDLGLGSGGRFKDLYLSGGAYLGGTGSANKLDDYETGTWTPVLTGAGYSFGTHTGRYVKVGNLVYITALFNVTTIGSNNSIISWSGAPFTTEAVTNLHQMGVVRESSTTGRLYQIQINAGSSSGSLNSMDGIAGGSNEIFTTGNYAVSVTYRI